MCSLDIHAILSATSALNFIFVFNACLLKSISFTLIPPSVLAMHNDASIYILQIKILFILSSILSLSKTNPQCACLLFLKSAQLV